MKTALTVAGSDPSSGAGIQADIRVFHSIGVHPLSVVASITVQNSMGVSRVVPIETGLVVEQLQALLEDFHVSCLKTGLLGSSDTVKALSEVIKRHKLRAVVDPVLRSTSGYELTEPEVLTAYRQYLLPVTTVLTPNVPEAEALTGLSYRDHGPEPLLRSLRALGPEWVVLKGGHRPDHPGCDILFGDGLMEEFPSEVHEGQFHGTGCVFSASLTACLALGDDIHTAMKRAKAFVQRALGRAYRPGRGMLYPWIGL